MLFRRPRSLLSALTVFSASAGLAAAGSGAGATVPSATSFGGHPAVGALFSNPTATGSHGCTASVVASRSGDTVLTAAHCLRGNGTGYSFVPQYRAGAKPFGVWTVTRAYVDPRWKATQDPKYDVAILTVAPHTVNGVSRNIQWFTGGYRMHWAPYTGNSLYVPAYNGGSGDMPIRCTAPNYYTSGFPGFTCNGYYDGVSGAPFILMQGGVNYVAGVIGGLHQGGCSPQTSYSSPFVTAQQNLLARAQSHAAADVLPVPGSDGC